jgi:hypothetical protein
MNDTAFDLDHTEEETFTAEISDGALEAAVGTDGGPSPALSFNFSSFHLQCC